MPLGKFWGVMLGAWGVISRSSSRLPVWKPALLGCAPLRRFAVGGGAAPARTSRGQSIRTAPGGHGTGAEENAPQAGAANAPCPPPAGGPPPRGLPACALATSARSRRQY